MKRQREEDEQGKQRKFYQGQDVTASSSSSLNEQPMQPFENTTLNNIPPQQLAEFNAMFYTADDVEAEIQRTLQEIRELEFKRQVLIVQKK